MRHVKVVKREERNRRAAAQAEAGGTAKGETRNAEREMAVIISRWVGEFRRKQRAESQRIVAEFFGVPVTASR